MIDALQSAPLVGNFVYASLKTAFADLAKKNLSPMDWDGTEQARKAFDAAEDKEARYLLNVSPGNKEIDLQEWYDNERKFASNVFSSLSMCVRIPGADRDNLVRFQQWSTEEAKAKEGLRTLQTNLETFQKSPPELSTSAKAIRFILDNIWSFILVTALSLKFARGIAGLRK